ncbi:4-phosphoerythronate dehydrogenase [Hyaloraphidium curvatum]|nr:4-phosphoerythronate dehydrogenase [Hyaloraphidium curvatum]
MPSKPVVLYPEGLYPDAAVEGPIYGPGVELRLRTVNSIAELRQEDCEDVVGLCILKWRVTKEDFARFPKLKAVCRMGVGYDGVDRKEAERRGVLVMNLPDYGTTEVADHAMALILALRRGLLMQHDALRTPPYKWGLVPVPTILRMGVQTVGIVGLGRMGTAVALRCKAFGMDVVCYDPYVPNGTELAVGARRVRSLAELCRQSHVLTVHCPLTPETRMMIGKEQLALLPEGAIVVNTARGPIVDDEAVYEALKSGKLAGAGLDCLPDEPPADPPSRLIAAYRAREPWLLGRLAVSSHVAYYSPQAAADIRRLAAETMASAVVEGRRPQNVILPSMF